MASDTAHLIQPDDPRLTWQGTVSLQRQDGWLSPWRLPYADLALFPPERLQERAAMPAGVRLSFLSDTTSVAGALTGTDPESSPIDLCVDGEVVGSQPLSGREGFSFEGLAPDTKLIELWLPQFGPFRLRHLELSPGATVLPYQDGRPRWVTYGSSITQCRGAASPTQTWPAIVARNLGLNLTCLGFGGECHLDPMVARVIRDAPAAVVSLSLGINVQGGSSMSPRTFRPAVIGTIQTVREGHPDIPLVVRSAIYSPPRETSPNLVGLTLRAMRDDVQAAVRAFQARGDRNIHYVNGLNVLGPQDTHLIPDDLHPNAEGYRLMGRRFSHILAGILAR